MVMARIPFQTQARAGAVQLVTDYAADVGVKLQVYPARPRSIAPPTAFVDRITETLTEFTSIFRQRSPVVEVVVIHGLFDSLEAATQKDAFIDGFLDWVADRQHAFGANTLVSAVSTEDLPGYTADWPPLNQVANPPTYYATLIRLEGFAAT